VLQFRSLPLGIYLWQTAYLAIFPQGRIRIYPVLIARDKTSQADPCSHREIVGIVNSDNVSALPSLDDVCLFGTKEFVRRRNGGELNVDSHPDKVIRNEKAVDLLAHDKLGIIVVEHTTVVKYKQQIKNSKNAQAMFSGFEARFADGLKRPGTYTLYLDPIDLPSLNKQERTAALDKLETWVREQHLPYCDGIALGPVQDGPPNLPVAVRLYRRRCSPEDEGTLRCELVSFTDIDTQFREMLVKACECKCPKLQTAKDRQVEEHSGSNIVSLLVLGFNYLRMAGPDGLMRITYTVTQELKENENIAIPDAIIWVDTTAGKDHWNSYLTKNGEWSSRAIDPAKHGLPLRTGGLDMIRQRRESSIRSLRKTLDCSDS